MFEGYPKYSAAAAAALSEMPRTKGPDDFTGHDDEPATDHGRPSPNVLGVCDGLHDRATLAPEQSAGKSDGSSLDGFVYARLS
jgi:hypothetical protein